MQLAFSAEADPASLRSRALVFAPHPDDEVLGCGGTVARKACAGASVGIVFMTDGAASHPGRIDSGRLAVIRRSEALEAAKILRVPRESVYFLNFPDHALDEHHESAVTRVRELLNAFGPEEIFVPHRKDRLADHVATFHIVREALATYPHRLSLLEYPVWLWNTWPWTAGNPASGRPLPARALAGIVDAWHLTFGCQFRVHIESCFETKRTALLAYRSQVERPDGDSGWPILEDVSAGEFLACFRSAHEVFRRSEHPR